MKLKLLLLLFFIFTKVISQTTFNGKLIAENAAGISVLNISNFESRTTNNEGEFSIAAKPTDTLLITSDKIYGIQLVLNKSHFQENIHTIKTRVKARELEEVVIKIDNSITALSTGIIQKKMVTYSPAERRLKAKDGIDSRVGFNDEFNSQLNTLQISSNNSDLVNNLLIERKEQLLMKLAAAFNDNFYTKTLKIPSDNIKGFQYYLIENSKFVQCFNSKNKIMLNFLLCDLAMKYTNILKNE